MKRQELNTVNGTRPADGPDAAAATGAAPDPRFPGLWMPAEDVIPLPLAGQPGHGGTAVLRRQPGPTADGGAVGAFEIVCCECGDNPYLGYSQVSPRLQRLRGPYAMAAGVAAYETHLGLAG